MIRFLAALGVLIAAVVACRASSPPPPASSVRQLAWTLGEWTGTRRDGADGTEVRMLVRVVPILGDAGQTEEIEVYGKKRIYRGFGVEVFDEELGRWVMMYANASHGHFARYEGTAEGAQVDWWSTTTQPPHRSRLVWERPEADRWRRVMSVSDDDGKTWRVLWRDELVVAARRSPI